MSAFTWVRKSAQAQPQPREYNKANKIPTVFQTLFQNSNLIESINFFFTVTLFHQNSTVLIFGLLLQGPAKPETSFELHLLKKLGTHIYNTSPTVLSTF